MTLFSVTIHLKIKYKKIKGKLLLKFQVSLIKDVSGFFIRLMTVAVMRDSIFHPWFKCERADENRLLARCERLREHLGSAQKNAPFFLVADHR